MGKSEEKFEETFDKNEQRTNYFRLRTGEAYQELYKESLFAAWHAYKTYQPDKDPLATYFNYYIRNYVCNIKKDQGKENHLQKGIAYPNQSSSNAQ